MAFPPPRGSPRERQRDVDTILVAARRASDAADVAAVRESKPKHPPARARLALDSQLP